MRTAMKNKQYAIALWVFLVAFLAGQGYSFFLNKWTTENVRVAVEYYDMGCHSWAPEGTPPINIEIVK
jgi:hypothetical protein